MKRFGDWCTDHFLCLWSSLKAPYKMTGSNGNSCKNQNYRLVKSAKILAGEDWQNIGKSCRHLFRKILVRWEYWGGGIDYWGNLQLLALQQKSSFKANKKIQFLYWKKTATDKIQKCSGQISGCDSNWDSAEALASLEFLSI